MGIIQIVTQHQPANDTTGLVPVAVGSHVGEYVEGVLSREQGDLARVILPQDESAGSPVFSLPRVGPGWVVGLPAWLLVGVELGAEAGCSSELIVHGIHLSWEARPCARCRAGWRVDWA